MTYPSAPWNLQGFGLQTLHLIDSTPARSHIPSELQIVELWPGKTLGGIYIAAYQPGSVLEYNELIVVAGIVRYGNKLGAWISHIYVDNPDSVAGGREIWGLPKELAQFTWESDKQDRVVVRQQGRTLCALSYDQPFSLWQQPLVGRCFSTLDAALVWFKAEANFRPGFIGANLQVPPESPFVDLNLGSPWLSVHFANLNLTVDAPEKV